MTSQEFFDYLYYKCLPQVYRDYDDGTLKLFIETLVESGFKPIIDKEITFSDLTNPNRCPSAIVPIMAQVYGIEYYPTIPEKYYRKLLNNIIELSRRRGSTSCVRYLCRTLTGMEIELRIEEEPPEKVLYIDLLAKTIQDAVNIEVNTKIISLFIGDFIPYSIGTVYVSNSIDNMSINSEDYRASFMHQRKEISLPPVILREKTWEEIKTKSWSYYKDRTWWDVRYE